MSMGKIIAWLKRDEPDDITALDGQDFNDEFTHTMFAEYLKLRHANHFKAAIPQLRCPNDTIFLLNNTTFILAHILFNYAVDLEQKETQQFIKHLNDCCACFDEYCTIFHDYYSALND